MKYRAHRYPTRFPVNVRLGSVEARCLVTSVSDTGACLEVEHHFDEGLSLVLEASGLRLSGEVKWYKENRIGLAFDRRLSKVEVDRLRFRMQGGGYQHRPHVGFAR